MKSKERILADVTCRPLGVIERESEAGLNSKLILTVGEALEAMDIYAKQQVERQNAKTT